MNKYSKKPIIVESHQWTRHGDDIRVHEYDPYNESGETCEYCSKSMEIHGYIAPSLICPGDWIITKANGTVHSEKPNVFEQTYERVK